MLSALRVKQCDSTKERRSSSQTYGLALKVRATANFTTLIRLRCLLVRVICSYPPNLTTCHTSTVPTHWLATYKLTSHMTYATVSDYRIPQMLHDLGCLLYSPPLTSHIRQLKQIEKGRTWEIELRGCSIWCVELIKREILKNHPEAKINAILIDFFLYDTMKERELKGEEGISHHRTRSIWY